MTPPFKSSRILQHLQGSSRIVPRRRKRVVANGMVRNRRRSGRKSTSILLSQKTPNLRVPSYCYNSIVILSYASFLIFYLQIYPFPMYKFPYWSCGGDWPCDSISIPYMIRSMGNPWIFSLLAIPHVLLTVAQKTVHIFDHFALNALFHTNP